MSKRRDPRHGEYFDTPGTTDTESIVEIEPRRKRRKRRDSLGRQDKVALSSDGFQYRKRRPISMKKGKKASKNTLKDVTLMSSNDEKQMISSPVILSSPAPAYPDTSTNIPTVDWPHSSSSEVAVMKFLRQIITTEIEEVALTFRDEFSFVHNVLKEICGEFVKNVNAKIKHRLESIGALKAIEPLPNPLNDTLRKQETIWTAVISRMQQEIDEWTNVSNRPAVTTPDIDEYSKSALSAYCVEKNTKSISHGILSEATNTISNNLAQSNLKCVSDYSVLKRISSSVALAQKQQQLITHTVGATTLKPYQSIKNTKGLISSFMASKK